MDNASQIVFGKCDGTGAAINVCLGFVPRFVKVINLEDSGSKWPSAEYWDVVRANVSAFDEGVKEYDDGSQMRRAALASAGISPYDGGDEIFYDGETDGRWEDSAGTIKEEVYVDGKYCGTGAYKCIGDTLLGHEPTAGDHGAKVTTPPGFTIGTDSDLNQDGEQLVWMAIQ